MPLLDHFHPPWSERRHWQAFHSRWASAISDALNAQGLPEYLFAEPTVDLGGQMQVDVATLEDVGSPGASRSASPTVAPAIKTPPAATWVMPAVFPATFEVRVISTEGGPRLVAAVELVSPANKDRPDSRRVFAIKCASYLAQGVSLIIMDVVTSRSANLHNEIMDVLQTEKFRMPPERLYATAYRPIRRESRDVIDMWPASFGIGDRLPSLALYVASDLAVMVEFEASYQEACQRLRLV